MATLHKIVIAEGKTFPATDFQIPPDMIKQGKGSNQIVHPAFNKGSNESKSDDMFEIYR